MKENIYQQKILKKIMMILISCCFVALTILNLSNNVVEAYEGENYGGEQSILRSPYASQIHFEDILPEANFIPNTISVTNKQLEVDEEYKYLSDLNYITTNNWSYVGWGSIRKDMPPEGSIITLKIGGTNKIFLKGIGFHANAQLTYDISQLSGKYTKFITKAGVDASRGSNGDGVIFIVQVSNDGVDFRTELYRSNAVKGTDNALNIEVDIAGYKYLRIIANQNRNNTADHAVLGGAKIVTADYEEPEIEDYDKVHTLEYYDNILGNEEIDNNYNNNYRLILEREFVRKIGYNEISALANLNKETKDTLDWLLSSNDNLEQVIEVGEISSGIRFIKTLTDLHSAYKEELTKENGDVYKKMMIAMAAAYTTDGQGSPLRFSHISPNYNYVERFGIIKDMYEEGLFLYGNGFKTYHIELFRAMLNSPARNDELRWLNYRGKEKNYNTGVYAYMGYVTPNYNKPYLWAEANREKYDTKWHLTENGVPYGDGVQRYWMVQQEGGVCWNMSRNFTAIAQMMGRASIGSYQPQHEVTFFYVAQNSDGTGIGSWGMANNIFGWGQTSTKWYGGNRCRTLFDWANKSFTNQIENGSNHGNAGAYIYLGQANLNRYTDYKKSVYLNLLANSYTDHNNKVEAYNKALQACEINLDSYDYKIKSYKALNKTSEEWHELAEDIIENYTFYPMAMNDILKVIRPYLNAPELIDIDQKEYAALQRARKATNEDVWQSGPCREVANVILGRMNRQLATFSFDGENAGKIILSSEYDGRDLKWLYSIDGGTTKLEPKGETGKKHFSILSAEEIEAINTEDDIKIYIVGLPLDTPIYTIDITQSAGIPSTVYANDWENKFVGLVSQMQWKMNEEDEWTLFTDAEPALTGNKTIKLRRGPTGVAVASEGSEYTFTEDNQPETRKYIPIRHLSIHAYSTQSQDSARPFYAPNVIDGNINTLWHTDFAQNVLQQPTKPFITIKLDEAKNISALEFTQRKPVNRPNDPDDISAARAYVSIDGETWVQAGKIENCSNYGDLYAINFETPVYGQYVKIEMDTTSMFASLALVNLYEDTTVVTLATFSFDGEKAGKLLLLDDFKGQNWQYSLDGGINWNLGAGDEHQLTQEEIAKINANDKIKIRLTSSNKESTIEIQKQDAPNITAYLNDLENRLIGITNTSKFEWRTEPNTGIETRAKKTENWTSYDEQEPIVEGNTKLIIRKRASGILTASDGVEFIFTDDNQPNTAKYVPIKHLSIESFSSTTEGRGEPATNAIDGLPTTMWHTSRVTTTMKDPRWIVIELDEPRYISKIEYVRKAGYGYGVLKNGSVSVSIDGETWEEAVNIENLYNPTTQEELTASENSKDIVFTQAKRAKYIKIDCTQSCDYVYGNRDGVPMDYFFSAAMFNLFEDTTKVEIPTASIEYSTTELTNQDVVATLVNKSTDITVTNNNGEESYTFTQNGEFTFEFVDSKGTRGTATATVDWICKTLPTATIQYNTQSPTNGDVIATITFDRDVKILNEAGEEIETITTGNAYTYTFTENKSHEVRFKGPYGNIGRTVLTVDWIDKQAPTGTITYSSTDRSNKDVIATITFDEENVTITNNDGNNTYTFTENKEFEFQFVDKAGNTGTKTAVVNWIDKTLPTANITYSTENLTNQDVIATVTFTKDGLPLEGVTVEGGNTHIFEENGTHEFKFVGPSGNKGTAMAKVDWIDKKAPIATITYDINKLTNKDVTATITFDKENVTITNNNGNNTYTFTENGIFSFTFEDKAGNQGTALATVSWIDKVQIGWTITYDINDITNQNVTATITFDKAGVKVVNDKGEVIENGHKYVFTDNGTHEFKFIGPAGNTGTAVATVTWIDKIPPVAIINYDITAPTNGNVTATVTFDEGGVTIVDEQGNPIENGDTHVFTQNESYTFHYIGPLGNRGTAVATVTWIDKVAPTAEIRYSTTEPTNKNVTVKLVNASEEITITNNGGNDTYTFTDNGEFTFEFVDKVGNKGDAKAIVKCIDKKVPVATIEYSETKPTNKDVIATIKFDEENVTVTGGNTHTFTGNGEFTFEFVDCAGNKGTAKAVVNWINKNTSDNKVIFESTKYKIEDKFITMIKPGIDDETVTTIKEFKQNITTNQEMQFLNKDGKELGDNDTVVTGIKVKIGETKEYTLIVRGDIDGDGKITINDLASLKLHCIEQEVLEGEELKAANVDTDNIITINDLAVIKLLLVGLMDISELI